MIDQNDQSPAEDVILEQISALEADLEALRKEADQAARLATLGLLTATIAHELRNVLTPVLSYAQIAQQQPDRPDLVRKALDRTISGVRAAAEIIESTLEFGTPGTPSASNESLNFANVREVVDNSLKCLARDPSKDGVRIEIDVADDLNIQIRPMALQQVLLNLILNAIKAMKGARRGREQCISIHAVEVPGQGLVQIELSDTGPGFSEEFAAQMFQPFVTTGGDDVFESGGTGLGLVVCKRLVTEAGGRIAATASPGSGATFTIHLPAARSAWRKAG